jgi:penicillin-binding protein 2
MFGRDEKVSELRLTAAQYIILGIFLVLAYGLWKLQVMESGYYSSAAEKNRVRNVPVLAPRGKILDREGRTIVDNYPSFSALLLRDSSRDLLADADLISQGLHLDPNEVRARIRHFASMPQYQPIFLKEDITPDELQFIEAHRNELPELDTIMSHRRLYPRNGFMAHLIGYVGEVSEDMLNQPQFELYNAGDVVGISGVERQYNTLLMGQNGSRQALVDSHGREVGRLGETEAIPGKPLKLTIDIDLQIAAEEALGDKNGHGEPANFRSQRFCGTRIARSMEQAGHRSRQAAAEQSHPGATGSGLDLQGHHVVRRMAGRHCPDFARALQWQR